jgi:hypothetical protein
MTLKGTFFCFSDAKLTDNGLQQDRDGSAMSVRVPIRLVFEKLWNQQI